MRKLYLIGVITLTVLTAACGKDENAQEQQTGSNSAPAVIEQQPQTTPVQDEMVQDHAMMEEGSMEEDAMATEGVEPDLGGAAEDEGMTDQADTMEEQMEGDEGSAPTGSGD